MTNRLPKDLPGGWEFNEPFHPEPLSKGQIWRKCGPLDAIKIIRVMQPGHAEHDGAAPGMSVRHTVFGRSGVAWGRRTWFWMGNEKQLHEQLRAGGFALAK